MRVHTEYPELTRRFLEKHGVDARVTLSYGATEAKIPEIADAVVEITETGRALRAAGLRVLDTILVSYTELIANPSPTPTTRSAGRWSSCRRCCSARSRPGAACSSSSTSTRRTSAAVIALLPALKSPTVSKLYGEDGYAVETVVAKSDINILIPALKDHGATGILELPIGKIVQ